MYEFLLETRRRKAYMFYIPYKYEKDSIRRQKMKRTALVLAALIALPGAAFAGTNAVRTDASVPAACATATVRANVDCTATGSVEKARPASDNTATGGKKLGIDVNPWSISNGM